MGASDCSISKRFFSTTKFIALGVGIMDFKVMHLLVTLLFICSISINCIDVNMSISKEEDLELEKQLKILNKSPVKIIQTGEGDIIDCVDIYKQPAFDHPLLKNHKLQLRPTSLPVGLWKTSSKVKSIKIGSKREACPSGTVPIKRTRKEDLIRARSLSKRHATNIDEGGTFPGEHMVNLRMNEKRLSGSYLGVTAYVSIYNLSIAPDQSSSTNMWVESGPPEEVNIITTGWTVSQQLNGDNLTRLFTYWTGDGYHKTGCYNTLCPGFVQTNKQTGPNVPLDPASTRGGDNYDVKLLIYQDSSTGNWWLVVSDDNVTIGYFPKELFNHLGNGAQHVSWGGISTAGKNGISPPMGNGNLPNDHFRDTCFFRQLHYIDNKGSFVPYTPEVSQYVDKSGCFGLVNKGYWGDEVMGYAFMFGGPGGNCGV